MIEKKITENLDFVENFVENSNFIRESTDAGFRGRFAVNSQEKYLRRNLILEKLLDVSLLQYDSATDVF